ncbi:transcription repressor OFP8 [Brachypodium distachyon]|uniref:Transcription repressor n=1 Tax=Brachypodium distachyon TaxID=15368 RepID=A0A0Q3IK56_BRADI|nr:transcription repressor OFP8 [Brachypodium distachyon]KQK00772.1 hypothetical protein BRADI_3g51707v3 [Brachypodium distachyon]|eukprot:XP_003570101.1 transcription repressor OFP8 [Brachypodium distachyon]
MLRPGISVKKRQGGGGFALGFALGCGCKDAKSVSVCASPSPSAAGTSTTTDQTRPRRGGGASRSASTATDTPTSASSSSLWEDAVAELDCNDDHFKTETTAQSFSGLLRELSELEQSVVSWGARKSCHHRENEKLPTPPPQEQCRKATRSCGDLTARTGGGKDYCDSVVQVEVGLDGSLAVVKQSEDPLGDFRESMVQMIVENGIVGGEELREMLRRFLALNAPHHHDVILRAFAEIWDAVFAASFDPVPVSVPAAAAPAHKYARREPPMPRTPPRHRHTPSAWRV